MLAHIFETIAREAFLKGCIDVAAAEFALYRDPKTLNEAVQFTQTAQHNHKLLSGSSRPRVRHVSFSEHVDTRPPAVKQAQLRQTGTDQIDICLDWSEVNRNMRDLLSHLKRLESETSPTSKANGTDREHQSRLPQHYRGDSPYRLGHNSSAVKPNLSPNRFPSNCNSLL